MTANDVTGDRVTGDTSRRGESTRRDDEPVLPDITRDERDVGWGDDPEAAERDERWYRRQRPPHWE